MVQQPNQDEEVQGKSHTPQADAEAITVEVVEPSPVLRGDVRLSNYFIDFWQPLIGYKAAATYAAILRFAYGGREECAPSISRLAASLGMTRNELKGRVRRIKQPDGSIRDYQQAGTLDVLVQHQLLKVTVAGNGASLRYHFKIRRTPPLLTAEQVKRLPPLLQVVHRKLLQACQKDRTLFEPGKGEASPLEKSGAHGTTAKICSDDHGTRRVVPVAPPGDANGTREVVPMAPRSRHNKTYTIPPPLHRDGQSGTGSSLPEVVVVVVKNSLFQGIQEPFLCQLITRYGAEKVALSIDVLTWQYRQSGRKVRDPGSLLRKALRADNLEIPEDYVPYWERLQREQEARDAAEAKRRLEETQRQEEAERRRRAEVIFQQMSPDEQETYRQRALDHIPPPFQGSQVLAEHFLYQLVAEERLPAPPAAPAGAEGRG